MCRARPPSRNSKFSSAAMAAPLSWSDGTKRKAGKYVSRFAVTHGKRTKGNEVKPVYVRQFMRAVRGQQGEQGSDT